MIRMPADVTDPACFDVDLDAVFDLSQTRLLTNDAVVGIMTQARKPGGIRLIVPRGAVLDKLRRLFGHCMSGGPGDEWTVAL